MKPLAVLACLLAAGSAWCEADGFGLGDGHLGPRVVSSLNTTINVAVTLSTPASAGDLSLTVPSTSGFAQGTLVLLLRLAGEATPDGGEPNPHPLDASSGSWELARVASTGGGQLVLTAPLVKSFSAPQTQLISVPEYTDLTVLAGASVVASPWNGFTGGVVALLATGRVTVDGAVDVTAAGFRGGLYAAGSGSTGCASPDAPFPLGSQKGEGVGGGYGALTGFGRALNGGGGGVCYLSGGGGGGNAGPGGQGGRTNDGARDVGGRGGLALNYALPGRLTLGGGGGAGQGNVGLGTGGGRGGGLVLVRAGEVAGSGFIRSNGQSALTAAGNSGGNTSPGGGGAGGTIVLQVARGLVCGGVEVNGGHGGNSNGSNNASAGPGGGGGGGRIFIEAVDFSSCPLSTLCGLAGVQGGTIAGPHRDAWPQSSSDPAYIGSITVRSTGYLALAPPQLVTPVEGSTTTEVRPRVTGLALAGAVVVVYFDGALAGTAPVSGTGQFDFVPMADLTSGLHHVAAATRLGAAESAKSQSVAFTVDGPSVDAGLADAGVLDAGIDPPRFLSRGEPFAFCGLPYAYSSTGEPSVAGAGPMVFSVGGDAVPAGLTVDPGTGALSWTPARAQEGVSRFELIATGPGGTAVEAIEVAVFCRDDKLGVGCGCSGGAVGSVGGVLLLLLARRQRARNLLRR